MDSTTVVIMSFSGLIITLQGIALQRLFNLERRLSRLEALLDSSPRDTNENRT